MDIKKDYLWGVLVIILVVVVVLMTSRRGDDVSVNLGELNNNASTTVPQTTVSNTSVKVTSTATPKVSEFTNIFPQGGNYQCVYEEVTPSRRSTNTIYFSEGKMRGKFRTLGGASNIMVYDGNYLYTWVEGQATGKVSQPKSISDFPPIVPKDITEGKVLGSGLNNVSWDCHAWAKNASLLLKPTYVTFN